MVGLTQAPKPHFLISIKNSGLSYQKSGMFFVNLQGAITADGSVISGACHVRDFIGYRVFSGFAADRHIYLRRHSRAGRGRVYHAVYRFACLGIEITAVVVIGLGGVLDMAGGQTAAITSLLTGGAVDVL